MAVVGHRWGIARWLVLCAQRAEFRPGIVFGMVSVVTTGLPPRIGTFGGFDECLRARPASRESVRLRDALPCGYLRAGLLRRFRANTHQ